MHFISSNLLHDFPNGKYMLFSLILKKKKSCENTGQPNPTQPVTRLTRTLFNLLKMTRFLPATHLTYNPIDPTQT